MPQPTGADLDAVRTRRDEIRERYLRPREDRPTTTAAGIHHAAFIAKDVEETIRFYTEVLGFPLVELVENRDYAGSSHFFFDLGNGNLLGFFDFPGHDHPEFTETVGSIQHLAISRAARAVRHAARTPGRAGHGVLGSRRRRSRRACTSATPTASGIELYREDLGTFEGETLLDLATSAPAEAGSRTGGA